MQANTIEVTDIDFNGDGWHIKVGQAYSNPYDSYHIKITRIELGETGELNDAKFFYRTTAPCKYDEFTSEEEYWHRAWHINESWDLELDVDLPKPEHGLVVKYEVKKVETGELVNNCFVLRPDKDPAALKALLRYANATKNVELKQDLYNWIDSIIKEKTQGLKAFAIGPDRYEVVVGYDQESVVAWYKQTTGISENDWDGYEVSEYPMDKPVNVEAESGKGYETVTVREFVADVEQFPCIAWWTE